MKNGFKGFGPATRVEKAPGGKEKECEGLDCSNSWVQLFQAFLEKNKNKETTYKITKEKEIECSRWKRH